jgi:hypothetical protein
MVVGNRISSREGETVTNESVGYKIGVRKGESVTNEGRW